MKRSTDRILATHAGALPRPDDLKDLVFAKARGDAFDANLLARRLRESVAEVVRRQVECGMDFVNDGEISKTNFTNYCRERLSGFETRHFGPGEGPPPLDISGRDEKLFPEYFASGRGNTIGQAGRTQAFCVAPLQYTGQAALIADIDNLKSAVLGLDVAGTFMNANTPGTIEHWLHDEYYKNTKDFLFAIAEAMRVEYLAIIEAGFMLQIDDPDLPDGWQMFPEMSVADYRAYAQLRVDALNHALRGIPKDMVQLHVCWGSFHGPHQNDIPARRHHRHRVRRARRTFFDRSFEPDARTRVAPLREGEIAAERRARARRRRALHRLHRASRTRRRAHRALREGRRA